MKNTTLPALRVSDGFRHQVEQALGEGETLSAFIEDAVRHEIDRRQARAECLARGLASAAHARTAIGDAVSLLERFPPSCRMPDASHPRIREGLDHGTDVSHHVTRVNVRASGARSGCAE
ncbi:YlcI/YnfO family protein [Thioalkalivibrio sp. ALJ24]|uniref:YlcI/YnfO family protein n=1 Tax=Thioalkalivibrio sp. ALJ24 TaxID=545276 RepID=UPI003510528D